MCLHFPYMCTKESAAEVHNVYGSSQVPVIHKLMEEKPVFDCMAALVT